MVFSGVLHGVNPGLSPIAVVVGQSGTLVLDRPNWVTEPGLTLELPQSPAGRGLEVFNSTSESVLVNADSGATISGVTSSGAVFTDQPAVRILPGQRAVFIRDQWMWRSQGAERILVFGYNGTPLANNPSNPLGASDLFHYLGIVQGGGAWTNPAGTAITSVISSVGAGTAANLTDRVVSGQNVHSGDVANSWFGWRFPGLFLCTGFLLQTRSYTTQSGYTAHLPRQFEARVNTVANLTISTDVSNWTTVQSWTGRTEITQQDTWYGLFSIPAPVWGNSLVIVQTGLGSNNANYFAAQEFQVFGSYQP